MSGCHVMAKPTSSRCNLDCGYCFYLEKPQQPPMDDATLEAFIRQHIAAQSGQTVEFAWQGGEPTLAGLPFYQRVVECNNVMPRGKPSKTLCKPTGFYSIKNGVNFCSNTAGWSGFPSMAPQIYTMPIA